MLEAHHCELLRSCRPGAIPNPYRSSPLAVHGTGHNRNVVAANFLSLIYAAGHPVNIKQPEGNAGPEMKSTGRVSLSGARNRLAGLPAVLNTQNAPNKIAPTNANTAKIASVFQFKARST
jgi:hypothetical protein